MPHPGHDSTHTLMTCQHLKEPSNITLTGRTKILGIPPPVGRYRAPAEKTGPLGQYVIHGILLTLVLSKVILGVIRRTLDLQVILNFRYHKLRLIALGTWLFAINLTWSDWQVLH